MPPSLLIRGRRQQLLLVSMLTCRTGLSSPTLLRSISAGTRTSRRRALRAQSSGSRELQTPASPRPRAAKRWVRRVSTRSARAQSPGLIFARHLDAVVSYTEIALVLACAGGCIDGHGLEMFDHCICSCRVGLHRVHNFFTIRVHTSATIKSAPPVMFFPQIFPKMVSTQLFASERNAKACEVIDEVSRSSFTPEVHTSTLFCVAAPPLSRRAHLRGEQGAVMSTCMRVRGVCYRIWGGGYQDTYPDVSCMYPDVS
jgi:hypothetical protein